MLLLLIFLLIIGLAGGYWFMHSGTIASSGFWELAGVGMLMMFLMLGLALLIRLTRRR